MKRSHLRPEGVALGSSESPKGTEARKPSSRLTESGVRANFSLPTAPTRGSEKPKKHKKKRNQRTRERIKEFGTFLQKWRLDHDKEQEDVAKKMRLMQSRISQLEAGWIPALSETSLAKLADAYDGDLKLFRAKYLGARFALPSVVQDLLQRDVLDVDGLAKWERDLPQESALWIVAPNFVDTEPQHRNIRDAVVALLQKGCTVTYFIREEDVGLNSKFARLLTFFRGSDALKGCTGEVRWYLLEPREIRLMVTSFVIAHPDVLLRDARAPKLQGYLVISADGKPTYGIDMGFEDLKGCVFSLVTLIGEKDAAEQLVDTPGDGVFSVLDRRLVRKRSLLFRSATGEKI